MESLWILIPLSLAIAILIGLLFSWAVCNGQMDDLDSPAQRILIDDDSTPINVFEAEAVFPKSATITNASGTTRPDKALIDI